MKGEQDQKYLDCKEALHRVYHFLDGELTEERREEISQHLQACSPCLEVFGFETEIRRLVAGKCREQVPAQLRDRIATAIDHEHEVSKASSDAGAVGGDGQS